MIVKPTSYNEIEGEYEITIFTAERIVKALIRTSRLKKAILDLCIH